MRTTSMAVCVAILAPVVCAGQQAETGADAVDVAARTITEEDYARRVGVIAHDSMAGRDTPSEGLDKTAEWIASEFRRLGLRGGAGDGGFVQRYPLRSLVVDEGGSSLTAGSVRLAYGVDVMPLGGGAESLDVSGEVVLVSGSSGLGREAADEVRGKHAVLVLPVSAQSSGRRLFQLAIAVANAGAASVLVTSSVDDGVWRGERARRFRPSVTKGWGEASGGRVQAPPILQIRSAALERLLAGRDVDLSGLAARFGGRTRIDAVPSLRARLRHAVRTEEITAPNVVGILEGSDPALREEHVVFSGHMDHVGIGPPDANGDSIFNGADDDASGTVAVIEVAEAMASMPTPPRRSMVFLLVSGEEKGLWGSEWYAEYPSVPVDRLVANLNADMVGRNWPDTIVAIGKEHSDLGETLARVNRRHPELRMTAIDDLWPEERFYFRSDHYNFARKGVPVLFFFNGTHEDYHGRDDEPDRIDAEKAARIARLVFYLGVEIGDADGRPRWNPESYARIVSGRE